MALELTPIELTDKFQQWFDLTNAIVATINTYVVTVNSTLGVTTGNGFVEGELGANLIIATELRGGDANTPAALNVSSNAVFNGTLTVGNIVGNSTVLKIGANVVVNTTVAVFGNSTVNAVVNTSTIRLSNSTGNTIVGPNLMVSGNSTVNSSVNSIAFTLANSTVTFSYVSPSAAQFAATTYFLNANGQWATIDIVPGGSNTCVQFNDSDTFGGNVNFTFDKATNTVGIATTGRLMFGNSTVNNVINSTSIVLANSTVSFTFSSPTSAQIVAGSYLLNANGSWTEVSLVNPVSGSNTWVQFNDSGVFGSSAGMAFIKTSNTFQVGNTLVLGANVINQTMLVTTTSGTSEQAIISYPIASFRAAEFVVSVKHGSANAYQVSKILTVHDDGAAYLTEFAVLTTNGSLATFAVDISGGNLRLLMTPAMAASNVTISRTALSV